jgi:type I restriction enzyme S subunit
VDFDPVRKKAAGEPTGLPEEIDKLFPSEFEESELGKIPKGWKVSRFSEIAQNQKEQIAPNEVDPSIPYLGLEHLPRGQIYADRWGYAEDVTSGKFRFKKMQILFGKLRPYFQKVGAVPVEGICSTDILVLEPLNPTYFGLALMISTSKEFIAHSDAGSIGTKMPRTNWDLVSRYQMAIPCIDEIYSAFTEQIQSLLNGIFSKISENNGLSQARDALIPLLLSGTLSIKNVEKFLAEAA